MPHSLVTGASGFIGTHLVKALVARGDEVTSLVRRTSKLDRLAGTDVRITHGDVSDPASLPAAIADCDVIYHLAGLTKAISAEKMYQVNERGVANLMAACAARTTPPVVVLVSSLAAAGPAVNGQPREPDETPKPVSNYGRSKLAGERAAARFGDRVPLSILRPPIVIGEGDLYSMELFHPISAFGLHVVPGFATNRLSIVHVADLVQSLILAARVGRRVQVGRSPAREVRLRTHFTPPYESSGAVGTLNGHEVDRHVHYGEVSISLDDYLGQGIYYPADEQTPTYAEMGRLIAQGLGRKRLFVVHTPRAAVLASGAISQGIGRLIGKPMALSIDKAREGTAGNWICSPRTAKEELGFTPAASLADRFRQTAQWYQNEGWL